MNMLSWIVDGSFSTRLTAALLHFLWQGCVGGMLVIVAGWILRGAAARSRYSVNVTTMLLMAVCLPVTFFLVTSPDNVIDPSVPVQHVRDSQASPSLQGKLLDPAMEQDLTKGTDYVSSSEPSVASIPAAVPGRMATVVGSPRLPPSAWSSISSTAFANAFPTLSRWVAVLYFVGVALVLGRLMRGVWGGHRLRKLSNAVNDPVLLEMVRNQAHLLGLNVAPTIAWCEQISIPVVVGIVTPMILLPMAVVSGLTPSQLQALLLHELSHIRRLDPVVNLLQRIIEAILFFHPVVWFVSRRISIERELAADDMVLAAGWDRPLYADALVRVAELASFISRADGRNGTVLRASGTTPSEFKLRVLRLLSDSHPPKLELSRTGILVTLVFVFMGGVIAWLQTGRRETTTVHSAAVDGGENERVSSAAETSAPSQKPISKELEPFQGIWSMNISDSENRSLYAPQKEVNTWQWAIKRNEIAWSRSAGEVWHLTFAVDPAKTPKEIDLTYIDGPFKGQTCLGMYEWGGVDQDMLQMSVQDPAAKVARPQSISMKSGGQTSLIFLGPRQLLVSQITPDPKSKPAVDPVPVPVKSPAAVEQDSFQGNWAVDSCESEAAMLKVSEFDARRWRWTIKDKEITWAREGLEWRLTFSVDATKSPKQFDMTFLDGPHKGEKCLGIYDRDGKEEKNLKILMQDPGANVDRPTSFAKKAGSQTLLIALHAIPPVDPVKELALFQGTWCWNFSQLWTWPQPIGIGTDSDGRKSEKRWVIEGNRITWVGRDGERVQVSFTIDPFKSPKQIEFRFLSGPDTGKKSIGIYESIGGDEDNRWLCMTDPGSDAPRPTDISAGSLKKQSMISIYKVTAPAKPSAANELKRLQGLWNMDLCDSMLKTYGATQQEAEKWQWTIKSDEVLWSRQGELWKLKLAVDPSKRPREIDLTYLTGPFQGEKSLGMYEFGGIDGQSLMIAIQDPGAKVPRPQAISMSSDSKTGFLFLRPNQPSDFEREIGAFQGSWTLRNFDTGRNNVKTSWPLPKGKGPDKSGEGSELRWVVTGNEITWTNNSGEEIRASFTIDPKKRPKQIDLTFLTGPDRGETCPGIYQRGDLDENILWLCMADPESKAVRPKEFSYKWGEGRSVLSLYPLDPLAAQSSAVSQPKPSQGAKPTDLTPEKREAVIETVAETFLRFGDARSIGTNADTEYSRLTDKGEEPAKRTDLKEGVSVRYEFLVARKGATKVVILPTRHGADPNNNSRKNK